VHSTEVVARHVSETNEQWVEYGIEMDKTTKEVQTVMKPAQEKIEKIDQCLRIQPLRGGNLLYIT